MDSEAGGSSESSSNRAGGARIADFVLSAAGVRVAVDLHNASSRDRSRFESDWDDAKAPLEGAPDVRLQLSDSSTTDSLVEDIRAGVRSILASRGRWMLNAAVLSNADSTILVIGESLGDRIAFIEMVKDHMICLGHVFVGLDPSGAVLPFRSPLPHSARSTVSRSPGGSGGAKVSAIFMLDRSSGGDSALILDLRASLQAVIPFVESAVGVSSPLLSLARLILGVGGIVSLSPAAAYKRVTSGESIDAAGQMSPVSAPERVSVTPVAHGARLPLDQNPRYRAGIVDAIDLAEAGVLLLRESEGKVVLLALDREESSLWRAAGGIAREDLVLLAERHNPLGSAETLHRLERKGVLENEPWWRPADKATWVVEETVAVVLDLGNVKAQPVILEGSGRSVWRTLVRHELISTRHLIKEVAEEHGVAPEIAAPDIQDLLDVLHRWNLASPL